MRSNKFFYKLFILIVFLSFYSESRELSIKQLEERKQSDLERLKEREKKGKKKVNGFPNSVHNRADLVEL